MDLSNLVREMMANPDQLVGVEAVSIGTETVLAVDQERAHQLRRPFAQAIARIPGVEDGLSWKLFLPYVGQNGQRALELVAVGHALGLWKVFPDPESSPDLYRLPNTMFPNTSPISEWPAWSGVTGGGDTFPKVAGDVVEGGDVMDLDEEEKGEFLKLFG